MPYSKDPHKYPPQMADILAYLMLNPHTPAIRLQAANASSANGRRIQLQSYFKAVERHAAELTETAGRIRQRAIASAAKKADALGKADLGAEYREAQVLAETWTERALAAKGWLARAEGTEVVITRRTVDDTFAASIAAALAQQVAPPVVSDIDEQMRLFALAKAQMVQSNAADEVKTD